MQFWCLVYDGENLNIVDYNLHGVNAIIMIADAAFSDIPIYIRDVWMPLLFGACYCTFNMVYDLFGGRNELGEWHVYTILEWHDHPIMATMATLATFTVVIVAHGLLVFIYNLAHRSAPESDYDKEQQDWVRGLKSEEEDETDDGDEEEE